MFYKPTRIPFLYYLLGFTLIILSACATQSANGGTGASHVSNAIAQSSPMHATPIVTARNCPSLGSGRAAVMPAASMGQHQGVVYLWQQNTSAILRQYDTVTEQNRDLLTVLNDNSNASADVSPDGHWVIVTSSIKGAWSALQLVRVDGKYAQTLYCAQGTDNLLGAIMSPDQHYLAFNEENQSSMSDTVYLLDLTTGKIQIELSSQQAGFPHALAQSTGHTAIAQIDTQQTQQSGIHYYSALMPQAGPPPTAALVPIKWISNSSLYLLSTPIEGASGLVPHPLYQLLDIHKRVDQQRSNLKSLTTPLQQNECQSYDITVDNTQLVCSADSALVGETVTPAVQIEPVSGGTLHTVFSASLASQVFARTPLPGTILFTLDNGTSGSQLWKVHTDGTGATLLASVKAPNSTVITWAPTSYYSYLPWTNISHDGQRYALITSNLSGSSDTLMIGSMNGGKPITLSTNALGLVGWTVV